MANVIQADENGALVVPPGAAGQAQPGSRFTVEPYGDSVILRRRPPAADDWRNTTTPAQRVEWLEEWIANLPPSPPLQGSPTHRDSMYE